MKDKIWEGPEKCDDCGCVELKVYNEKAGMLYCTECGYFIYLKKDKQQNMEKNKDVNIQK